MRRVPAFPMHSISTPHSSTLARPAPCRARAQKAHIDHHTLALRAGNVVVTTESHPVSVWLEVAEMWKLAVPVGAWPLVRPTMQQREDISLSTGTSVSFVTRVVNRAQSGEELGPRDRGGANNLVLDPDVICFVDSLYQSDVEMEIWEYQQALYDVGVKASKGTISYCLLHILDLPMKKPSEVRFGKYTDENLLYMTEFVNRLETVRPERKRCLDEMGSDQRCTGRKRVRCPKGVPARVGTPGPKGQHLTTTGITSICRDQLALIWDVHEGGHTAPYHRNWMLDVAASGGLVRDDVLVVDNWSGHVGEVRDTPHVFSHFPTPRRTLSRITYTQGVLACMRCCVATNKLCCCVVWCAR